MTRPLFPPRSPPRGATCTLRTDRPVNQPRYDDKIVKMFLGATILWGAVGMLVGVIIALQIAYWPANLGLPWPSGC